MLTCHTPTIAFAIKINKITKGSTKAVNESSWSSNRANTWRGRKSKIEKKKKKKLIDDNNLEIQRSLGCSTTCCAFVDQRINPSFNSRSL